MQSNIKPLKVLLRKNMRKKLRSMSPETLKAESQKVAKELFETKEYQSARALCVFVSMPKGEIDTTAILQQIFKDGKRCFVPRCISKSDMVMLEAKSMEDIDHFPKSNWMIPEPPLDQGRATALECQELDMVVVPGLAFDDQNRRCGQGAGFYDRFFQKLEASRKKAELGMPKLVGICLPCQVVDQVPTDDYDYVLDNVVTFCDHQRD